MVASLLAGRVPALQASKSAVREHLQEGGRGREGGSGGSRRTRSALIAAEMALAFVLLAGAACWVPARRATRVDALVALRNQ